MNKKSLITLLCVIAAILVLVFAVVSLFNNGKDSEDPKNETSQSTDAFDVIVTDSDTQRDEPAESGKVDESTSNQTDVDSTSKETDKPKKETQKGDDTTKSNGGSDNKPETTANVDETSGKKPETDKPTGDESNVTPPEDLPPVVPVVPDNGDETSVLTFPCKVEGYGLTTEKLALYNGMYVEDGTNVTVDGVAMLLIVNNGNYPVEYAQIKVEYNNESLLFDITALPAGERVVVQEKNGKKIPEGDALSATALVVQEAELSLSEDIVSVVDNGDNTLTIKNMTNKEIPTVRVFYKYYMKDEKIFVGGISFTVRLTRLGAGETITIQPSHFTSSTSRVVMVSTYNSEV